jgi:hypothetical protein
MNDPVMAADYAINHPDNTNIRAVQKFVSQYMASILTAAIVAILFFPGNRFLPVPWQCDDYINLSLYSFQTPGQWIDLSATRPVSTNVISLLGRAGDTTFFLTLFFLAALLPVLAAQLALRLFRCRPEPWAVIWLVAAVAFCTFLCEESPWFYRYTGMMTSLTSVITGFLAAYGFSYYFDGKKKSALAFGGLMFLATAFSKEDVLLFVPLFAAVDWFILRLDDKQKASLLSLGIVLGWIAVVGAMLLVWNTWIVPSEYTANLEWNANRHCWTPSHIFKYAWQYATYSHTQRVISATLAAAVVVGLLRRGHRVVALGSLALVLSLILPYTVLLKFRGFYSLNWVPIAVALALVGIAVAWRPFVGRRLAFVPWMAPVSLMAVAILVSHSAAKGRLIATTTLNQEQEGNCYIVRQLLHHQTEFADAKTVALRGIDAIRSPWFPSDGRYINLKLGKEINWLLVAGPKSRVAENKVGRVFKNSRVKAVSEQDLAAYPGVTILDFDKELNLTVHSNGNH